MIVLELFIVVFFGMHVGKEIFKRKAVEQEVVRLEAEISKLENKSDDLSKLLEYAKTDSFVEIQAREKLNLAKQGESVVVIPEVDAVSGEVDKELAGNSKVLGESNIKLWWEYFFDYEQLWLE